MVGSLHAMAKIAGNAEMVSWCFHAVKDMCDAGLVRKGDITPSIISGVKKNEMTGGKGLAHLLVLKRDILVYLSGEWAEKVGFDAATRSLP